MQPSFAAPLHGENRVVLNNLARPYTPHHHGLLVYFRLSLLLLLSAPFTFLCFVPAAEWWDSVELEVDGPFLSAEEVDTTATAAVFIDGKSRIASGASNSDIDFCANLRVPG
ncbi:hypothetical protein DFH09DRAFT_1301209 [Mycena vulgaris]|nr:hypothetical protein DFH09DRAFT_1301209 [Mycena vulgaris]